MLILFLMVSLFVSSMVYFSFFCTLVVVRYIGTVEFAEGCWLGLELYSPSGKNDGSVQDHRYFTCKPNHGVMVKPSRVSLKGINGAKLLGDQLQLLNNSKLDSTDTIPSN